MKKSILKRTLSAFLSTVMIVSTFSGTVLVSNAADKNDAKTISSLNTKASNSGIVINEVCLGNDGNTGVNIKDSKDKYADWIELFNSSDAEIDISGWGFTDTPESPYLMTFESNTKIPAKGYLVVPCGKNLTSTLAGTNNFGPFGLSGTGETLVLTNSTGAVETLDVPEVNDDITYSRKPDGSDTFAFTSPTPNATNNNATTYEKPDAPVYSRGSGCFDSAFMLTLSSKGNDTIYYTTDGSDPRTSDTKIEYKAAIEVVDRTKEANYLSAKSKKLVTGKDHLNVYAADAPTVKVDKGTVFKAVCVGDGGASDVITNSYFVGITNATYATVPIVSIVMDEDDLYDPNTGIYVNGANYDGKDYLTANWKQKGKDWERPVHIDYIKDNKAVLSQDCGMRIQGGFSRGDYQKSLRLYAKSDYGPKSFNYDFFNGLAVDKDGNKITSFKKITLRNGGNDANYIKFKDSFIQRQMIGSEYATQASVPAIAFINGEYWGIYTMQEDYNDDYIQSHYGVDKDEVVMIKPDGDNNNAPKLEEGLDTDLPLWDNVVKYLDSHDLTKTTYFNEFAKMIDYESFADYCAAEMYISNEDWPYKNWEVWRSRTDTSASTGNKYSDGKFRFMMYDVEMGVFLWGNEGESSQNDKVYQIYKDTGSPIGRMFTKLMQNINFSEMFFEKLAEYGKKFSNERVKNTLTELKNLYYPNLQKFYDRFPNGGSLKDSADLCLHWIDVFFNGGTNNNKKYISRNEYLPKMINYNKLIVDTDVLLTTTTNNNIKSACDKLKNLLGYSNSSIADRDSAFNELAVAMKPLYLDEVTKQFEKGQDVTNNGYSVSSWNTYQKLLTEAEDLILANNPSTMALRECAMSLQTAYQNLKKGKSISSATVSGIANKTYNGKAQTQNISVKLNGETLKAKTDYTVSYSANTNAGTAKVIIKASGDYTGSITKTFKIVAKKLASSQFSLSTTKYGYTGTTKKPAVKSKLKLNKDYTVTYSSNLYVGTAKVTIKGKGNYTGTITKYFSIVKQTAPGAEKVTKLVAGKKTVTVTYAKKTGVKYKVLICSNRSFKGARKVLTTKTSVKFTKLVSGRKYYVKVCAYKTYKTSKTKAGYVYGKYSALKAIRAK